MLRSIPALLLLATLTPSLALAGDPLPPAPRLKAGVTVQSDVVRIGDLVENAGSLADIAIFRAPDLGGTGTVSAADVLEAVRAHDLIVVDTAGIRSISVTRAARQVSARDLERQVADTFAGQYGLGDAGKLSITFDEQPRTLYLEPQATGELQVARSSYNPKTQRFDVTFNIAGSALARQSVLRYSGTLVETVAVPVLLRPLNRGETVRSADVAVEKRPKADITSDTFLPGDTLVGYSARHSLRAGQPLRRADLARPEMVRRDEFVTLQYEMPGMLLSVRGKAAESGAEGDVIGVLNVQSKRTVQGIVTGPGRVTMVSSPPVITADAADTPATLSSDSPTGATARNAE
jgi:flagella basal body P-ring formation protein FlgA